MNSGPHRRPPGNRPTGLPQGHRADRGGPARRVPAEGRGPGQDAAGPVQDRRDRRHHHRRSQAVEAEVSAARRRYAGDAKTIAYFDSERSRSYLSSTLRRSRVVEGLVDRWPGGPPRRRAAAAPGRGRRRARRPARRHRADPRHGHGPGRERCMTRVRVPSTRQALAAARATTTAARAATRALLEAATDRPGACSCRWSSSRRAAGAAGLRHLQPPAPRSASSSLGDVVEDHVANLIIAQLLFLQSEDPERDISLYINSPGGIVTPGLAIYDTMEYSAGARQHDLHRPRREHGQRAAGSRRQGQALTRCPTAGS